jgi:hypothetical protein
LIFPLKGLYSQTRNFSHFDRGHSGRAVTVPGRNMDKPLNKGNKNNAKFYADQRAGDKKASQHR